MGLSDAQRARYARHLLLPELGETGQLRLLAALARPGGAADAGALAVARGYLSRAGLGIATDARDTAVALDIPDGEAVVRLAGAPELVDAARALAGAFAAVEAIKAVAQIGARGELPQEFSLATHASEPEPEAV
jgi:adenylyltransferase/sulfurtransferase